METCPQEILLQRQLQLWPELQQCEAGIKVHVISIVHEILVTLQIQKLALVRPHREESLITIEHG